MRIRSYYRWTPRERSEPAHGNRRSSSRISSGQDRVFAVESVAEYFEESLRSKHAAKDKTVSNCFSPGYCEWSTKQQKKLDKILSFKKAGIKLTKSFMMVPKKSVSGIIGIGRAKIFSKKRSQCSICDKKDCSYRRASA